jgi:CBS domain-containing protein
MRDEDTGIVPVVDDPQRRKVVGVVTDRDLCMRVIAENRMPQDVRVEECMTTRVVSCSSADAIERATELMKENQIRRIPVVDEHGVLQGIVSMADLVERADLKTGETHDTLKKVSEPSTTPSKPRAKSRGAA